MITHEEITEIGKFQRTHALKGELNAVIDIDPDILEEEDFPLIVEFDGILVPFYCTSIRPKGHFSFLIKLDDIDTEEEARSFVNKTIYGLRDRITDDDEDGEGGGYATDFIGYRLVDTEGREIGEIADVDLSTDNALFILDTAQGSVYVPIADEFIKEIDNNDKIMVVDLPEGLIDLNTKTTRE